MMELNGFIDNLIDSPLGMYWLAFTAILGNIVGIASVIAPMTKTPKDDEFLAVVKNLIARFSFLQPRK